MNGNGDGNAKKKRKVSIPMKRLNGEIKVEHSGQVIACRVILTDLGPKGVSLFTESQIEVGAKVTLVLEQPKHLFLKAELLWCNLFALHTHVLSNQAFIYRAGLVFHFENPEQEREFREFCDYFHRG